LGDYTQRYQELFKVYRRDNSVVLQQYFKGMFHEGKHNIERMNERIVGSQYHQLHHFISESPWAHQPVLKAVGKDLSRLFEGRAEPVGLIIDESGHRKQGKKSVGVARQYLGSVGKVDNGQVGVFAALSQGDDAGMVDVRLFLPKDWADDDERCGEAGIPEIHRQHKTKPELALEMVDGLEGVANYEWVGGDGLYGHSSTLRKGLSARGKMFILDVHEDQLVYLGSPEPALLPAPKGRGRKPVRYASAHENITVKELTAALPEKQWKTFTYRRGLKGLLVRQVICLEVYLWASTNAKSDEVEHLRLIVSRKPDGTEIKYSLTNDLRRPGYVPHSEQALLYRQMQRYWVERGLQDCKDTLGMTDYQVRTWRAWHHHITLTIMALHYMLEQKVLHENEIPLLSCPDIKFFFAMTLPLKASSPTEVWDLIQTRQKQRRSDLMRFQT